MPCTAGSSITDTGTKQGNGTHGQDDPTVEQTTAQGREDGGYCNAGHIIYCPFEWPGGAKL